MTSLRIFRANYLALILGLIVAVAAIPLGGNTQLAWAVLGMSVSIVLAMFAVDHTIGRTGIQVPFRKVRLIFILYSLVCFWIFVQSLDVLPRFLDHPLWGEASQVLNKKVNGAISLNPGHSLLGLLRLLIYASVFRLALQLGRNSRNAEIILYVLAAAILLNAVYALILWSSGSQTILWYEKWVGQDEVTGTFVNRNHFAAYIGVGCLIWLSLLLRGLQEVIKSLVGVRFKYYPEKIISSFSGRNGLYLLGFLVLLAVLMMTRSRAGILCAMLGMIVYFLLTFLPVAHSRKSGAMRRSASFVIGIIVVLVLTYSFGGNRFFDRISVDGVMDSQRLGVFSKVIDAIKDSPLVGSGFGTFPDVFPSYRDSTLSAYGRWYQAHNTYLENIMELGLPAALLLFLAVGLCILTCFKGLMTRKKDAHYSRIAFSASAMLLLHSVIDFPLQIAGIVVCYSIVLGLGVTQSWSSRE